MSVIQRHRSVSRGAILALILLYAGCRDAGQSPIQPSIDPAVYTRELLAREITVRARHHTAETAWNEGRFDEAIVILRGILELDPIHPLAFQGLVQVQARRGDLEAAGPLLDSFAGVDSPGIHYGSGLLQLFSGGNDEAHAQIEMARDGYAEARHPSGYAASETALGILAYFGARYEEALGHYGAAMGAAERLEDRRSIADLLVNRATVEREMGNADEALADFRRARMMQQALNDRDGLSASEYDIGLLLVGRGEHVVALESLRRALAINRELGDRASEARSLNGIGLVHDGLGETRLATGKFEAALTLARDSGDRQTEADALTNIAVVDLRAGRNADALDRHNRALSLRREIGDRIGEAASLANAALVHEAVGRMDEAVRLLEQALAIHREIGPSGGLAPVLISLGRIGTAGGVHASAVHAPAEQLPAEEFLNEAIEMSIRFGDRRMEAAAREEMGRLRISRAEYGAARTGLTAAYQLRRQSGDPRGEASTLRARGVLHTRLAEFEEAGACFMRALSLAKEWEDRGSEAATLIEQANVQFVRADYGEALRLLEEALLIRRDLGHARDEATTLNNIGAIYRSIGDGKRARRYVHDALERSLSLSDRIGEALARNNIGVLLEDAGDHEGAIGEYRHSIDMRETTGDRRGAAFARHNLASVLSRIGEDDEAAVVLHVALKTFRDLGDRVGEALALIDLGDQELNRSRIDAAGRLYEQAERIASSIGMEEAKGRAEAGRAACLESSGKPREALALYRKAIATGEATRGRLLVPAFRARYLARRSDLHERTVGLIWRSAAGGEKITPGIAVEGADPAGAAEAFAIVERSRARGLLDLLAEAGTDLRASLDPALLREEDRHLTRTAQLEHDLSVATTERSAIERKLARVDEEFDALRASMRRDAPIYAEFVYPEPSSADEIRTGLLEDGEILLEYFLGERASFLWSLRRSGIRWWRLPPRSEIERAVRKLLEVLRTDAADLGPEPGHLRPAGDLARILLPPGSHRPGARLLIAPDGILHHLPFEALRTTDRPMADEAYLIERHEISYAPSASALRFLRRQRRRGGARTPFLLAVADPEVSRLPVGYRGMEPLPFAREEVRRIGELFAPKSRRVLFGTAASEDAVRAHVEKTTHLHIAAHGIIDESRPSRSGLLVGISIDGRDDGILSMNEIYRLRLDADLAVLSGCSTGRGEMLRGEGIVGLTRAFLYAGARSVVVSLWNVNDRSTAPLMEAFYREMIGGRPAASALRQAKIGMLRSADRAHRHPARWAPFVLIGDSIGGDSIGKYPEGGSIQADS